MISVIIGILVLAAFLLAVRSVRKNRSCSGCSCGCRCSQKKKCGRDDGA